MRQVSLRMNMKSETKEKRMNKDWERSGDKQKGNKNTLYIMTPYFFMKFRLKSFFSKPER